MSVPQKLLQSVYNFTVVSKNTSQCVPVENVSLKTVTSIYIFHNKMFTIAKTFKLEKSKLKSLKIASLNG